LFIFEIQFGRRKPQVVGRKNKIAPAGLRKYMRAAQHYRAIKASPKSAARRFCALQTNGRSGSFCNLVSKNKSLIIKLM
jgi:hypothetical protein